MLMAYLRNQSYNKYIIYSRSIWRNPIWLPSSLFCIFSINILFSKTANILYTIFDNVIGLQLLQLSLSPFL